MEQKIDLKQLELKVWRSFYGDGLGDIILGCVILMFALAPLLSDIGFSDLWSSAIFLPFWAAVFIVIILLRRRAVIPRIGMVSFGQARKKRLVIFNIVMFIVLSVSLILGLLSFRGTATQPWVHNLRFMAVMLIGFGLAAYFLGFARLYVYGILVALSIPVGEWLYAHAGIPHHGWPITFGFTAGAVIVTGVIFFVRFLRNNPRPRET
jgi:hypothetical protein